MQTLECTCHIGLTCNCAAQTLTELPVHHNQTLQTAVSRMHKSTWLGGAIVALQLASSAFGSHIIEVRPLGCIRPHTPC
jgi:hypothetical protein